MPGYMRSRTKKGPGRKAMHRHKPAGTKLAKEAEEKNMTKRGRRGI